METIEFIPHKGSRILIVDYSEARDSDLRERIEEAGRVIQSEPENSLLILLRARDVEFTRESTRLFVDNLRRNRPHVRATAIVGLAHLTKVVAIGARLTGRRLEAFDDEDQALDWLASLDPAPAPQPEEKVRWIEILGERILLIDFTECDDDELEDRVALAASIIRSEPPESVLALNLVRGISLTRRAAALIKEYVRGNRPYILAAAVVGLGYMKAVIPPLNRITGRNMRTFDDDESASAWLVTEKSRLAGD